MQAQFHPANRADLQDMERKFQATADVEGGKDPGAAPAISAAL